VPAHDRTCPAGQAEMIFRRCGWALAVVYAGVHVAAATELTAPVAVFRTDWGIQLGPITLIPGVGSWRSPVSTANATRPLTSPRASDRSRFRTTITTT
jgi:hypothetical protein